MTYHDKSPQEIMTLATRRDTTPDAVTQTRQRAVEIIAHAVQTSGDHPASCEHFTVTKAPADCTSKEDVRAELDRIDQSLLSLFAERHRYVTRMA